MHFVGLADRAEIQIVGTAKPFETLVNEYIVHQEITDAIQQNAKPNPDPNVIPRHHSGHDAEPTGNCKNQKKGIVLFKKARLLGVVIIVQYPKQSMHHVFVREPSHEFHEEEGSNQDEYVDGDLHIK